MFGPEPNWFMQSGDALHTGCRCSVCDVGRLDTTAQTDGAGTHRTMEDTVDFLTGLTNVTNWCGNVIMPTLQEYSSSSRSSELLEVRRFSTRCTPASCR